MGVPPCLFLIVAGVLCVATAIPSVEVVLAHYREDLTWMDAYAQRPHLKFTVYSKGERPPVDAAILSNVGREAHTYLYHLTHSYHQLADWTVFSQAARPAWGYPGGDTSGHLSDTVTFDDYLHPFPGSRDSFFVLSAASHFPSGKQTNRMGFRFPEMNESVMSKSECPPGAAAGWTPWWWEKDHPHLQDSEPSLLQFYHQFIAKDNYSAEPMTLIFAQGARFAVSRQRILRHPRAYYAALLERVSYAKDPIEGYWLEAAWYDVFHPEALQSKRLPCTLPPLPSAQELPSVSAMEEEVRRRLRARGLMSSKAGPLRRFGTHARMLAAAMAATVLLVS